MNPATQAIALRQHQPERERRSVVLLQPGCCCCCCCCCLHTVGSLGGAILVTAIPRLHSDTKRDPPLPTAAKRFWLVLSVLSWVSGSLLAYHCLRNSPTNLSNGLTEWAVVAAICIPGVQLAAFIVTGLWILIAPANRRSQLWSLLWLFVWSLGGFLLGSLVVWMLFKFM